MKRDRSTFQDTRLFDWDTEPKEERPSEFHSTGFTTASGYYRSLTERRDHPVRRRSGNSGPNLLVVAIAAAILIGGAALYWLAYWLRG